MRTKYWLIIIGIILLFSFFREGCNQRKTDNLISDIANYKDTAKYEKLKNGALISTNVSLKLQSQDQLKALVAAINDTVKQMFDRFKKVNNVTHVTNQFYAGKDTIKYETKIPCSFAPFKVRRGTPSTYKFVGTIGQDYFAVDSLSIEDKTTLIFGRKKVGFMKYDYAVDINHSNPLMISTNIKDYKYEPKKKWFERTWVHWVEGAIAESVVRQGVKVLSNR